MVAVGETVDMVVTAGPATREEAVLRMEEAGGIRIRFFSGWKNGGRFCWSNIIPLILIVVILGLEYALWFEHMLLLWLVGFRVTPVLWFSFLTSDNESVFLKEWNEWQEIMILRFLQITGNLFGHATITFILAVRDLLCQIKFVFNLIIINQSL